jgi:hypothetical protein
MRLARPAFIVEGFFSTKVKTVDSARQSMGYFEQLIKKQNSVSKAIQISVSKNKIIFKLSYFPFASC